MPYYALIFLHYILLSERPIFYQAARGLAIHWHSTTGPGDSGDPIFTTAHTESLVVLTFCQA